MESGSGAWAIEPPAEESSFEGFFSENYEHLLRAMYLITGSRHEAEDLAQEACSRVFERWDALRGTGNPAGYAYRIALNLHRSRRRRLAVAARRVLRPDQTDHLASVDDRDTLRRALADLPIGQRQALVLLDWVGLSDAQAARILNMRPTAVRMQASRARRRLRDRMKRGGHDG